MALHGAKYLAFNLADLSRCCCGLKFHSNIPYLYQSSNTESTLDVDYKISTVSLKEYCLGLKMRLTALFSVSCTIV